MSDRRLIAFHPASERAVVGCILNDAVQALPIAAPRLKVELFFDHVARTAITAIGKLHAAGIVPDVQSVTECLREEDLLATVGGEDIIRTLADPLECCQIVNLEYEIDRLEERAAARLVQSTREWEELALGRGTTPAELAAGLEARATQIRNLAGGRKRSALPEIESAENLLATPVELPPELVTGLLHRGAKMVIGGGSKSYKTWLLTDLALSVATGTDWLGRTTATGPVLYINLEIQRCFFRSRLEKITAAKGIAAGQLDVWNLRGYAADISLLIAEILERVGQRYSLIVVDPIYKVLGDRDENAAGDIGSMVNELERLAVKSNAAVVFGAHFSKGNQAGKESIDRIVGSGVYGRDPDAILTLTRHEEEGAFTVEPTLRDLPPIDPFVVRWEFPLMVHDGGLDPSKLKQVAGRPKTHSADELYDLLADGSLTYGQWLNAAKEHAGMSKGTFVKLRGELLESGRVHQSGIDRTYEQVRKVNK